MIISKSENTFKQLTPGMELAVVSSIIDCGTQTDEKYGDKHKMMITLTLPNQLQDPNEKGEELPSTISKWFTVSLHEKSKLRPFIEGIMGVSIPEDFDTSTLLGKNCQVHLVEHTKDNGDVVVRIATTSPLAAGMATVDNIEPFEFSFDSATQQLWEQLSERMQNNLRSTPEYGKWERNGFMPF